MTTDCSRSFHVSIVGGAGHIGFPLALVLTSIGNRVQLIDVNAKVMRRIMMREVPYREAGAQELLDAALNNDLLRCTDAPSEVANSSTIVVTLGTPVDRYFNPCLDSIKHWLDTAGPYISDDQLVVLRSTVFPGTTAWLERCLGSMGRRPLIAYCPERAVEGFAINEIRRLPQFVSGMSASAEDAAHTFFSQISRTVIRMSTAEAEFAKLFANAYRYINFAISNQFFMLAESAGVDFYRVANALRIDYDRMTGLAGAGLTGGPCLLKDTMQLVAYSKNGLTLGKEAMFVNEGLVYFLIDRLERECPNDRPLSQSTVGLLGMAFKSGSDDIRSSLSYKLKEALEFRAKSILTTDPFVPAEDDPNILPLEQVIRDADVFILCTPHAEYRSSQFLKTLNGRPIVDVWGFTREGQS